MLKIILTDTQPLRDKLLPFTFTRPLSEIRVGILTITEKWIHELEPEHFGFLTQEYLSVKYPHLTEGPYVYINGAVCPNDDLVKEIKSLKENEVLYHNQTWIATFSYTKLSAEELLVQPKTKESQAAKPLIISQLPDIFAKNGQAIEEDFKRITKNRTSEPIPPGNQVLHADKIFIEPGAKVLFSILNAENGPIYIGKDAEVMEGSKIRGPFAMCEHSATKMDAKIYGPTTLGPHCKVGGEVNNAVFFGYSNKGHDGFVGNAVIGEWCNLGADTNNSNLKNTYDEVKLWSYATERFEKTGLTFCGLMMADHSKCGINTMFNTGTVVGVGANIFGSGFPRNFVPSFAWGGAQGFDTFVLNKFYKTAEAMCSRRNIAFTDIDKQIIKHVFEVTSKHRFWEKTD